MADAEGDADADPVRVDTEVVGGVAQIDAEGVDCREDAPYWAKYAATADQFGLTDAMANYSTRIRISIDKVWGTPTEG